MIRLVSQGLAAWRVARLLVDEDGPSGAFYKLRELTGIEHDSNGHILSYPDWNPLHCVYCTTLYTAVLVGLLPHRLCDALAASGLACIVERWANRK